MRAASTLTAIGSALLFAVTSAHGLGFGRVVNATQLGQPLNFAAALRLDADESLERECVSAEVQSGDNKLATAQVRATLEGLGTERNVRVTTLSIIDEPVVTISVTVGCTSKITRKFVAFIDPPLINLPDSSSAQATLPPQRNDSQVAPLVTLVEGEKPAPAPPSQAAPRLPRPERAPTPRVRQRVAPPPRTVAAPQPIEPSAAPRPPRSTIPRQSAGGSRVAAAPAGPRLKLEAPPSKAATAASAASMPLPAPATPTPPIAAASAPEGSASAAVAAGSKDGDLLAAERERIRLLEEGLNKLRTDSQATQNTIGTLQAKLKEAESQRYSNPLVYGLAWLSALLALAMLGLLWRQARVRNSSQWWTAPTPTQAPPVAQPPSPGGAPSTLAEPRRLPSNSGHGSLPPMPAHLLDDPTTGAGSFGVPTVIEDDAPTRAAGYAPTQVPTGFQPTQPAPAMPAPPETVRELSVEELIDLEQQAEFFVVLGQDEAAIELLMSHVRTDGGISPLPYLKLLEIYRRRGESDAYERIRDRFNRRFNAYAPDWDADMQHGRTLEDYPETINRLQELWSTPTRAMETLDASLFRRNKTDETFDLPAYRELLFLYSVSRDLAEHGGSAPLADVDVLLPLSDDPNAEPISRLSATTRPGEFKSSDMMTLPLDLDVSFPPEQSGHAAKDSGFIDFDLNEPYEPKKKKP